MRRGYRWRGALFVHDVGLIEEIIVKKQLNDLLESLVGYKFQKPKPKPKVRFVKEPAPRFSRLLRFSYFYDLCSRSASIPGNIVECGVGRGESLLFLCVSSFILSPNKVIYALDSFKGLPSLTKEDKPELLPDGMKEGSHSWSKESVIDYLLASGLEKEFIDKKIRFIEGYLSELSHEISQRRHFNAPP